MAAPAITTDSPFFRGIMAPVLDERDDRDLKVSGKLPAGLNGLFVRNGPNPQFVPMGAYHPFDGDGMLHGVYLEDGRARYRNHWIESKGLLVERNRGHACYGSVSQFRIPDDDVVAEGGFMKNTSNTHTVRHAGRYLALMEAGKPTEFSRELQTVGEYDFNGKLEGAMTAHPKVDPKTGEMIFIGYSPFPPYLRHHVVDASGALVQSAVIDLPAPIMMHDFVTTEHYSIFFDAPAIFNVEAMMRGEPAMRWEPDRGTRIGVLPRHGRADEIRWFEIPNCYVVHFFNAWDTGRSIHIYAPAFESMPGGLAFDNPVQIEQPKPWKWTIDLDAGTVKAEQTDDESGEFPRIDDRRAGRKQRYMYNALARSWEFDFDFHGVIKYDVEGGGSQRFIHGDTAVSGEHIFAPNPSGTAEDDGWLLTMVTDRQTEQSALVVLDARDLAAGPVARVHIPRRVPLGFHASWFPES